MLAVFGKYVSVGVVNTSVHWSVFWLLYAGTNDQAISNLAGFLAAVTLSFYLNARWTFNSSMSLVRYVGMVVFMSMLSWVVGRLSENNQFPPIVMLVMFSAASLVLGFFFTKCFVFRSRG